MSQQRDECSYLVDLFISCQHLKSTGLLSKNNALVVVYNCTGPQSSNLVEVGRTEMIVKNENPKFLNTVRMLYSFEKTQKLQFVVYAVSKEDQPLCEKDRIGEMNCQLGEICGSKGYQITKPVLGPNDEKNGFITILAEDVAQNDEEVILTFKGTKMVKMDILGKSDPYFILSRMIDGGTWLDIYKSEVIKKTLEPDWEPFVTSLSKLCKGDHDLPLRFKCFDWNSISAHGEMGEFQTSFKQLLAPNNLFTLTHNQKNKEMGIITCATKYEKKITFLQYLAGGLEISLILGIDFTLSNGMPQNPSSLHYMGGSQMNQYEQAIRSVGEIVSNYDQNKMFPVFGFGTKLPPNYDQAVHCFPLNGDNSQPECFGVNGVLDVYRQALNAVQLYGPTYFAPIINHAIDRYASEQVNQNNQRYFILLMITDGAINDMNETIAAIIRASQLPMSIIIVGVGSADFSSMNILDSDESLLKHQNQVAKRKIVQFVPFSKFASNYALLAEETLAEIPHQVTQYFTSKNILPKDPIKAQPFQQNPQFIPQMAPQHQNQLPYAHPQPLGAYPQPSSYPIPQQPPQY